MGRVRVPGLVAFALLTLAPLRAHASFHLWQIKEVYSNADGSIQYIELYSADPGQTLLTGHTVTASDGTTTHTFTFATDPADSNDKHLLLATPGFKNLQNAPTPDYTLPCGPFFDPSWTNITISFPGADTITFTGASLPKDGTNSLTDTTVGTGTTTLTSGTNSPTNISGVTGPVTLTAGQVSGAEEACDDGAYCNGVEVCAASACSATAPCPQQCVEDTDTCVECTSNAHCNDNNPCTDDVCDVGGTYTCSNDPHVGSCDDGLFCNGADTCSGTTCMHAGDPCGGINCNEGPDTCANCTGTADCEDGESCTIDTCDNGTCSRATAADGAQCDTDATFCNGVGTCTAGVCAGNEAPCDPDTSMCDETNDACSPLDVDPTPDAGDPVNPATPDDEGGCCQANTTPAVFTGPLLVLGLAFAFGRRRRRR